MHTIHHTSVTVGALRLIRVNSLLKTMHQPCINYALFLYRETKVFHTLTFVRIYSPGTNTPNSLYCFLIVIPL